MPGKTNNLSRLVVKAMGLFGGVQMINIVCSIVRSKFVAIWIGPVGVGLFGLWNTALEMINTATNLGIRSSSVRDISANVSSGQNSRIAEIVTVVRRWSIWVGLGGALATIIFAPLLSMISFGDQEHIWGFVALSLSVLMVSLMNGEHAILQGTSRLKRLAKASVCGSVAGLAVSIPLFYFLRIDSVLPSIVAYAVAGTLFAYLFRNKDFAKVQMQRAEVAAQGKEFVRLGIFMTLGTFFAILSSYVFVAYLNWKGGTEQVGLYQAGYTVVNKYAGLVLSALAMEYYPRLSKVAESGDRLGLFVSQEINIALMALTPIVIMFMVLRQPIIVLLYSKEFMAMTTFVTMMLVGTIFRATSWCMAFVILAKGDGKTYVVTEGLSVLVGLALNMASYHYYGLTGLGYSFVVWYAIYNIIIGLVYFGRYGLKLHGSVYITTAIATVLSVGCAAAMEMGALVVAIAVAAISMVLSAVSLKRLLCR